MTQQARLRPTAKRAFGPTLLCLAALGAGAWIMQAQPKASPNFTGGDVTPVEIAKQPSIVSFRFGPGARTKWHSHSGGQIIFVEEGVARNQNKGEAVMELKAGETYYVKPNVVHWHGAAPKAGGVQYNITRGDITWGAEVTDAEYNKAPGAK